MNITDLSMIELRDALAEGEVSSAEATDAYLAAIERLEGDVSAFNEVDAEGARLAAAAVDAARAAGEPTGPLAGVPIALKDNLCTLNGRTTCSSNMLAGYRSPYEATAVARLRQAGAVFLGKTNLDEFAMGSSTENSAARPTRNPWDLARAPGGSSGGSAAAVAARLASAALGSDTGGSIRQPAAFCGVVGVKPTYGRVSRYGLVAFGSSLDQIGPIAQDVRDAALLTQLIGGHDPADSTSIDQPVPDYLATIDQPLEGLKLGWPKEFYTQALGEQMGGILQAAAETYRQAGAEVVEVSLPHCRIDIDDSGGLSSYAVACYYIVCMAEASSNLARYDGVHYGHRTAERCGEIIELYARSREEGFGPEVKRRVMLGTYALSSGYYDQYYNKALRVRRLIRQDFEQAFEGCDLLLCPVTPSPAFALGEKIDDPVTMYLNDIYTSPLNLAGLPGISLPAGLTEAGLPAGLQLIGPVLSEEALFGAARMYEQASGFARPSPPLLQR